MNDALATFFHPAAADWPERLHPASAWNGHIPFAMNLVAVTRPRVVVELGTHVGGSYCALCQAVAALHVPAACSAVDTWEGEEHSGLYGPEVLDELRAHHDPRYSGFSRLLQMRFDDAAPLFSDGSVDLLHIDGCHAYDAVKHDFERWLPKLSPRGVVLVHDTVERERDFGVWRLWDELQAQHRCFGFTHSHGLGVVAVGPEIPEPLERLLAASDPEVASVRALYAALGRRLDLAVELRRCQAEVATVEKYALANDARVRERDRETGGLRGRLAELERLLDAERLRADENERRATELERAERELRAAEARRETAAAEARREAVAEARREAAAAEARREAASARAQREAAAVLEAERARAADLSRELERLRDDLAVIRGSRSWRAIERWRSLRDRAVSTGGRPRETLESALDAVRRAIERHR